MTISVTKPEVPEKPQDSEVVLSVQGVSKKFCRDLKKSLFYGIQDITSELLGVREKSDKLRKKEFWALKDVSFQLRRGEALGLVGKNGSGKSTLLRIIAGLIRPDTGSVEIQGRIAPLIALGAGFNPILTGRENIYANMAILGLSKREIDRRFDAVVEFAEIEDAIDAPVQTYSSGMRSRLGFASAIHTEPDILLIDEVLAVGDSRFRGKCFRRLHELREQGTSFILVSHNLHSILSVCSSAVYLKTGEFIGVDQIIEDVCINAVISGLAEGGETILKFHNLNDRMPLKVLPGVQEIQIQMPYLGLRVGTYMMNIYAKKEGLYRLDYVELFRFKVEGTEEIISGRSLFYQPRNWNVVSRGNFY